MHKSNFSLKATQYDITFLDFNNVGAIAKFEQGLIVFGFNQDKNTPIASLSIILQKVTGNTELTGSNITLIQDDKNFVYEGSVTNLVTQGMYSVRLVMNESLFGAGNSQVEIDGNTATVNGTLGSKTYIQINDLINNNTNVDTLVLQTIDGSVNDDINLHTGRLIRNAKLTTLGSCQR